MSGAARRAASACAAFAAVAAFALLPSAATAALPHVVQPGETLWSIAAANNLTTRTVAAFNGLPEDAAVVSGQTIEVPTTAEGEQALISAGIPPGSSAAGTTTSAAATTDSGSGVPHTVQPGETLSGIAAANGLGVDTVAAHNGISPDAYVITDTTIMIPPAPPGIDPNVIAPAPGMGHVPSPWGELHLTPAAADAWNAMREESLSTLGADVYPRGPLSAYRTYEQQAYLYDLFVSGQGAPANQAGTSSHETGNAVDVETPEMRSVVDQIGWKYGWTKAHGPSEWWHVDYVGR